MSIKTAWRWLKVPRCVVLAREANRIALEYQRAISEQLGKAIIEGTFAVAHFRALFEQFHDFGMDVESGGRAHEAGGNFGDFFARQAGVDFERGIVFAVIVGRPVVRQLAKARNFGELAGLALLFLVFLFDGVGDGRGVDTGVLRINFPKLRMILDALVEARLGDRGVVDFAVAMAAVANQVDDHVGIEFGAIFRGEAADAHHGIRIFRVDMEDGDALAARDAGSDNGRSALALGAW